MHERTASLLDRLAELAADDLLHAAVCALATNLRDEAREQPPEAARADPLQRLVATYELSGFDTDLLLLAGLGEERHSVAHLLRLHNPQGEPWPTAAVAAEVLGLDAGGRRRLRWALEAGPLASSGIVTGALADPLPERSLRLAPGLWSVLRGITTWPVGFHSLDLPALDGMDPALAGELRAAATGRSAIVAVVDETGHSPADLAAQTTAVLEAAGRQVVALEPGGVSGDDARLVSLHATARGLVPVVAGQPAQPPLPGHPAPVVVCATDLAGMPTDDRPLAVLEAPPADLGAVTAMWHRLLPELDGTAAVVASTARVGRLAAERITGDVRAAADRDGRPVDATRVLAHARRRTDTALPAAVQLIRPQATFQDLVLADEPMALLRSCVDRVRAQARVLHEWGFRRAVRGGRGVRVLLAGPPGTGKSLAAEVLAHAVGLDLLVVDLSTLVSKWVGETEKHLSAVFDAAEQTQAVLLFDEADAIFGRRTQAADAQGRWANLETAHLLARMDAFEGLVALTTNLKAVMDEAFRRRLDVVIDLEEPDAELRAALWWAHLPAAAPVAADVDPDTLAGLYEINGGVIRNAALAAAFAAAARGRPIDTDGLVRAIRREYAKAGRSFPGPPRQPNTTRGRAQDHARPAGTAPTRRGGR